jgi:hypothetical protein
MISNKKSGKQQSFITCLNLQLLLTIFTNPIHLSYSFMKLYKRNRLHLSYCFIILYKRYRFCEQNYYNCVKCRNYPNKSCTSWELMQLCNWIFLFKLIYCFNIWFHLMAKIIYPWARKKAYSKPWAALSKFLLALSRSICREFSVGRRE